MATRKSGKGASQQPAQRQLADVRREAQRFKRAASNLSNAAVELWGARVDLALSSGDEEAAAELLRSPARSLAFKSSRLRPVEGAARPIAGGETQFYDSNGNCGCGGGGTGTAGW
jgi:hypothetical protein